MLIPYRYHHIVYVILVITVLVVLWILSGWIFASNSQEKYISISETYFEAPSMPYYPHLETYGALIDCLVDKESGGNPQALGDDGKAHGILQFHAPTFQAYCVEKYGYSDNIWSEEIQKLCASEMLEDNPNNVYHWTTAPLCL